MNAEQALESIMVHLDIKEEDEFQTTYVVKPNHRLLLTLPYGIMVQVDTLSKTPNFLDCLYFNNEEAFIFVLKEQFKGSFTTVIEFNVTETGLK